MATWFELSRNLKAGDRVVFTTPLDRFSEDLIVPAGTTCAVVANGLNEIHPTLFLLPDDPEIRKKLAAWDGEILLYCPADAGADPDTEAGAGWHETAPVELLGGANR